MCNNSVIVVAKTQSESVSQVKTYRQSSARAANDKFVIASRCFFVSTVLFSRWLCSVGTTCRCDTPERISGIIILKIYDGVGKIVYVIYYINGIYEIIKSFSISYIYIYIV